MMMNYKAMTEKELTALNDKAYKNMVTTNDSHDRYYWAQVLNHVSTELCGRAMAKMFAKT